MKPVAGRAPLWPWREQGQDLVPDVVSPPVIAPPRRRADDWLVALRYFLLWRLVFSGLGIFLGASAALPPPCAGTGSAGGPPAIGPWATPFLGVWQRWDTCWFEQIAARGYLPGDPSVAFFPLYPALVRAVSLLTGGQLTAAGLLAGGVAYVAALAGLRRLVREDFDAALADRTIMLLAGFPSAIFLLAAYSEAPFLALAVWALYAARRQWWAWATALAVLAALTRTQGCLLALPLAWEALRRRRAAGRAGWSLIAPLAPLAAFAAFVAYSAAATGWTTFTVQRVRWGTINHPPWVALAISWRYLQAHADVIEALNLALVVLFLGLAVWGARRVPVSYTLYALPQLLLLSSREMAVTPLMSAMRLVLVVFPVFVVLAMVLRPRAARWAWLALAFPLLLFLAGAFLSGRFIA